MTYAFRTVTRDDLPMLREWLGEPHVVRWWGDPEEQIGLIAGDIDHPAMELNIVSFEEQPFAYLQAYRPHDWSVLTDQPSGTHGVDPFIGPPAMAGKGHGPRFLDAFCAKLFAAGAPRVIIDPDMDNTIAIRAYEKAGFRTIDARREMPDGPVVLMARDNAEEKR
jgi:aminoglycoside 6'-N-acetyltransferase